MLMVVMILKMMITGVKIVTTESENYENDEDDVDSCDGDVGGDGNTDNEECNDSESVIISGHFPRSCLAALSFSFFLLVFSCQFQNLAATSSITAPSESGKRSGRH